MTQTLSLDFKLPGLNEYINAERRNRYAAAGLKKNCQEQIHWQIIAQGLEPILASVRLKFTWYEKTRKRDKDNVSSFGRKLILDALVVAGILSDDGNKCIKGFSDDFVYGVRQGVTVEIEDGLLGAI